MDYLDDCIHYVKEAMWISILISAAIIISKMALVTLGLMVW